MSEATVFALRAPQKFSPVRRPRVPETKLYYTDLKRSTKDKRDRVSLASSIRADWSASQLAAHEENRAFFPGSEFTGECSPGQTSDTRILATYSPRSPCARRDLQ